MLAQGSAFVSEFLLISKYLKLKLVQVFSREFMNCALKASKNILEN